MGKGGQKGGRLVIWALSLLARRPCCGEECGAAPALCAWLPWWAAGSRLPGTRGGQRRTALRVPLLAIHRMSSWELDDDVIQPRRKKNPYVMIGTLATAAVLVIGLVAFKHGDSKLSQQMMRARVVAQGATVAIMLGTSLGAMASLEKGE